VSFIVCTRCPAAMAMASTAPARIPDFLMSIFRPRNRISLQQIARETGQSRGRTEECFQQGAGK
jgi:hypothetical protein